MFLRPKEYSLGWRVAQGRALLIDGRSDVYVANGTRINIYSGNNDIAPFKRIDVGVIRGLSYRNRLLSRFLRSEVTKMRILPDGSVVAVCGDGIYRSSPVEMVLRRVHKFKSGRTLGLGYDGRGNVVFGEYISNPDRGPIAVFHSVDSGASFRKVYEFGSGEIRHIHNIIWDRYKEQFCVFTGDYRDECGICYLSNDFQSVEWIARGSQQFRAVSAIFGPDEITYGTDSHIEQNYIVCLNKRNGELRRLHATEGSSLDACSFGGLHMISTAVEPSCVNLSKMVSIYCSDDCKRWHQFSIFKKDMWHPTYFQFGTVNFPYSEFHGNFVAFSGQGVDEFDGKTWIGNIST